MYLPIVDTIDRPHRRRRFLGLFPHGPCIGCGQSWVCTAVQAKRDVKRELRAHQGRHR